jgi:hypothetical protein
VKDVEHLKFMPTRTKTVVISLNLFVIEWYTMSCGRRRSRCWRTPSRRRNRSNGTGKRLKLSNIFYYFLTMHPLLMQPSLRICDNRQYKLRECIGGCISDGCCISTMEIALRSYQLPTKKPSTSNRPHNA